MKIQYRKVAEVLVVLFCSIHLTGCCDFSTDFFLSNRRFGYDDVIWLFRID